MTLSHLASSSFSDTKPSKQQGFTLLEVLIAIGITAMIGLGSWQILHSAIRTSQSTQERIKELNALQKTMLLITRDFQQIVPRSIRDEYGDSQAALTSKSEFYSLVFTRTGWRNPLDDPRSSLQRVAYQLDQDKLLRYYWSELDRSQDSQSIHHTLLKGVESLSFRFMNSSGGWVDEWPVTDDDAQKNADPFFKLNELPKAVKLTLKTEKFGTLVRLFDLVSYLPNQEFSGNTGTGSGNTAGANNTAGSNSSVVQ